MSRWKLLVSIAVAAVLVTVYVGGVFAQEEEERPPAQTGMRGGPRGGQFDPEQMRQRGLELIQEALGATDGGVNPLPVHGVSLRQDRLFSSPQDAVQDSRARAPQVHRG